MFDSFYLPKERSWVTWVRRLWQTFWNELKIVDLYWHIIYQNDPMTKPDFMVMVPDLYRRRRRRQGRRRLPRHPPEPQGHLFCAHLPWKFANRHLPFGLSPFGHLPFGLLPFGHLPLDICRFDTFHFVKNWLSYCPSFGRSPSSRLGLTCFKGRDCAVLHRPTVQNIIAHKKPLRNKREERKSYG